MTKEQLAEKLNGREYGSEITKEEEADAKASGLVVIFGYSDDNVELRGIIHDEAGCYDGGHILLHKRGVLAEHNEGCECPFCGYEKSAKKCAIVKAVWCERGYSWLYETDIPHATFEIIEDGEKYCLGIVFESVMLPEIY